MQDLLTVVLPNRNRDLQLVVKSISSVYSQVEENVKLILVDYGSPVGYQKELKNVCAKFSKLQIILYQTQGQLWNKSRIINSVLKDCSSQYFMVSDIDMLWHPDFLKEIHSYLHSSKVLYFPVGFLTESESKREVSFHKYIVKGISTHEATGISIFPTVKLKSIGGFDEFYHGWGGEDTDVHIRLQRAGVTVEFVENTLYFKHQWHPKMYRSFKSNYPFAETLELINSQYLNRVQKGSVVKANNSSGTGIIPDSYDLNVEEVKINVLTTRDQVKSALYYIENCVGKRVLLTVREHPERHDFIKKIKRKARGKALNFITIKEANNIILEWVVSKARDSFYQYKMSESNVITLEVHYR